MQIQALVYETVAIEEVRQAVLAAGHTAEIQSHEEGRRTLLCTAEGVQYVIQFYPNEGHAHNQFGALRFVAWFSEERPDVEVANSYNAGFRFAGVVAQEDCYELQHDVIAIGVSAQNLELCVRQWATSMDDFQGFLADSANGGDDE